MALRLRSRRAWDTSPSVPSARLGRGRARGCREKRRAENVVQHGGRTRRVIRRLEFEILLKVKGVTGISNRRKHRLEIWGNLWNRVARSTAPNSPNRIFAELSLEALARERRSG